MPHRYTKKQILSLIIDDSICSSSSSKNSILLSWWGIDDSPGYNVENIS